MKYPKYERFGRLRKYLQEVHGMRRLKADQELWTVLDPICKASSSTGCTFHEMYLLYSHILRENTRYALKKLDPQKPRFTGIRTTSSRALYFLPHPDVRP